MLLWWALAAPAPARPGWLQTRSGQVLQGDIQLTHGAFLVTSPDTTTVPLEQVARVRFDVPLPTTVSREAGRGNGLLGFYFNTTNLTGDVVVRLDETIDFDWGTESPAHGVNRDYFSVVWMGELEAPASGEFILGLATDDGGRLWVDDRLVCESWQRQEVMEATGTVHLTAGRRYRVRVEYFDFFGNARARLFWSGPDTPPTVIPRSRLFAGSFWPEHTAAITATKGLLATYYRNSDFTGPTFTRVEPTIDLTGAEGVPAPNFSPNNASVRWSGQVLAPTSAVHTFYLASDEPARLWLQGQRLLEKSEPTFAESRESVPLKQGERYDLIVETCNTGGPLAVRLMWSSPSWPKAVVPATHLFPSRPTPRRAEAATASLVQPPGVLLRHGSFLAGRVEEATESTVRVSGPRGERSVSRVHVARLFLHEVPQPLLQHVPAGSRGALLSRGDFLEGELRRLEGGRLRLSSILFGARALDARAGVLAVFLADVSPEPAAYEVRLRDGSVLRAARVAAQPEALAITEAALGRLTIPTEHLLEFQGK